MHFHKAIELIFSFILIINKQILHFQTDTNKKKNVIIFVSGVISAKMKKGVVMKSRSILFLLMFILVNQLLFSFLPTDENGRSPFVQVVKNLRESVVHIRVETETESNYGTQSFFDDDFFKFFFPQMPQTRKTVSVGSGFVFKKDGNEVYIMTNAHVVDNGEKGKVEVTLADKAKFKAEIVGSDPMSDIAVIKIILDKHEDITVADFGNSDQMEVGDWAIAIGNPFGELGLERTVTVGVISATNRSDLNFGKDSPVYQDYIQTDAAINPGNSGGPLININGEVIGVNAAITSPAGGNVGIGFAIPSNLAKKVSDDLINKGKVIRAYLGIVPQQMTDDLAKAMEMDRIYGILVARIEDDTPAKEAGLNEGDVIVEFNNQEIPDVSRFRIIVANSPIGEKIPVKIIRDGQLKELTATLKELPGSEKSAISATDKKKNDLGLEVEEIDGEYGKRMKFKPDFGVVITSVTPDSPASQAGLSAGDVIQKINGAPVNSVKEFSNYIDKAQNNAPSSRKLLLLHVLTKDGNYQFFTLPLE